MERLAGIFRTGFLVSGLFYRSADRLQQTSADKLRFATITGIVAEFGITDDFVQRYDTVMAIADLKKIRQVFPQQIAHMALVAGHRQRFQRHPITTSLDTSLVNQIERDQQTSGRLIS